MIFSWSPNNLYMVLILYIRYAYPLNVSEQFLFWDRYYNCKGLDSSPPFRKEYFQPFESTEIRLQFNTINTTKITIYMIIIDIINVKMGGYFNRIINNRMLLPLK